MANLSNTCVPSTGIKERGNEMANCLTSGRFYGNESHRRTIGDLLLTDVSYPSSSLVPRHAHERPYFCWIRNGAYSETYGRRTRTCRPGMFVFHPAGEYHSEAF